MSEPPLFRAEGIRTAAGGPLALSVEAGECIGLRGPSGAGKSLLLRALVDLDPHEGRMWLEGIESVEYAPAAWRRRVGYLPAEAQWWGDRVGEHFPPDAHPDLAALGLPAEAFDWSVARCSTGERQRLALMRLLANTPRLLLLDEPTASLDPQSVARVEALLAAWRADGAGVVWVSHDPAQLARVADRHYTVVQGRLEAAA